MSFLLLTSGQNQQQQQQKQQQQQQDQSQQQQTQVQDPGKICFFDLPRRFVRMFYWAQLQGNVSILRNCRHSSTGAEISLCLKFY